MLWHKVPLLDCVSVSGKQTGATEHVSLYLQVSTGILYYGNPMPGGITGLLCFSEEKLIQEPGPPGWRSLKNRENKIYS
jgi:hypothetical protein